ncbi:hypothetical protein CDL12_28531 [Handroanthus impetiginosus]|uniref:NAB domain-containing protein n=1 Tax=Handroanthus impetiginosus TaxID=429701 RepID=A0A2G9G125_9LAMI|nr:hypothetical protein CDL12_28531 [Handroanthus impetiginosus]
MYYNKRPEIIGMVEDFYRTHRSLAERYDQVKSEARPRLLTARSSPLPFPKHHLDAYDSNSKVYQPQDSDESEVDNPEEEEEETEQDHIASKTKEVASGSCNEELMRLREELERLREENKVQKEQLMQKDEEKRDVIRQLSLAMDLLKEENFKLGQCVAERNLKKESHLDLNNFKRPFFGRLFNGFGKS